LNISLEGFKKAGIKRTFFGQLNKFHSFLKKNLQYAIIPYKKMNDYSFFYMVNMLHTSIVCRI
jgi:hypothetical protein